MDQLGNMIGAAKQVAQVVHDQATTVGLEPVPTAIVVALAAMFAMVGLVVSGTGRRRRGNHRA